MNTDLLYVVAVALVAYLVFQRLTSVKRTAPEEVLATIKAGASIIDVRTPQEYAAGSYRKAKNIPLAILPDRVGDLGPKDKPVVLFCASGARSAKAARFLRKAGFTSVIDAGGIGDMPR